MSKSAWLERMRERYRRGMEKYGFYKGKLTDFHRNALQPHRALTRKEYVYKYLFTAYKTNADKEVSFKCAALVYYTSFAIVPMLAFIFSVTDGLGLDNAIDRLAKFVLTETPGFLDIAIDTARSIKVDATSSIVAIVSFLILLMSVWSLMDRVSTIFKDIWKTQIDSSGGNRSFLASCVSRLSLLIFSPLLIIVMYAGVTQITFIESFLVRKVGLPVFFKGFNFLVMYAVTAVVFTLMYKYIPSVKVRLRNAVISGTAASFVFVIFQFFYILVQSKVSKYNMVYGAIAALPLFLIWAYNSWLLIINGAVLCHTLEHPEEYEYPEDVPVVKEKLTWKKVLEEIRTLGAENSTELKDRLRDLFKK